MSAPVRLVRNLAIALVCLAPAVALAEGNGLLLGESRLHLGVGLEGGYDSNVRYLAANAVSDYVLHVKPMVKLLFPSDKVALDIAGLVDVLRYFGATDPTTSDLSTVQGMASARADFNPKGKFVFFLKDEFVRTSSPRSDVLGTFARTDNTAGAGFTWMPGGGALSLGLSYGFAFEFFDQGTGLSGSDSYSQQPALDIKWRFFPKTSFQLNASADLRRYPSTQGSGATSFNNSDMNAIRASLGLVGMMTSKLSVILRAGYGNSLTSSGENFQSVIGQAEVDYDLTMVTKLALGYSRDFQPAILYGYYTSDKFYASARQQLFGKLTLSLAGSADIQSFGRQVTTASGDFGSRSDVEVRVDAGIEYEIQRWLSTGVSDALSMRNSSYKDADGSTAYTKNVALLKLTFMY